MPRALRMYPDRAMYFVTARTFQARMLLRPSARTNELIGGILARAVERSGIELHAYVVASNHIHLLCSCRGAALSRFMQFLLSNIARKVGRHVGWEGAFWQRRFSAEEVLDDAASVDRLRYILAHGVKEGLVRRVRDWPGLHCAAQLLNGGPLEFPWFNWSSRWRHGRLGAAHLGPFSQELATPVRLILTPLPSFHDFDERRARREIATLIDHVESAALHKHEVVLGVAQVMRVRPHALPRRTSHRPSPRCHATTRAVRVAWHQRYRAFATAYQACSRAFREGETAIAFPPHAYRPPSLAVLARF